LVALFANLIAPFDLLVFIHAGKAVLHGSNPYASVNSIAFRSGHAFVYPLFVAWIFAPIALMPVHLAEVLCQAASAAAIVAGCWLLNRRETAAPALVLTSATTIVGLQMGTFNAFLMGGIALAWHWRKRHSILAGVLLGLLGAAKLFLLPLIVWPIAKRRYPSAVAAALTSGLLIGAGFVAGPIGPRSYISMLSALEHNEVARSWSLASALSALGVAVSPATKVAPLIVIAGLAALWSRRGRLADNQVLGVLVLASLLASPILWSSYLLLAEAALLLVGSSELTLASAGLASWVLVTPDVASPTRIALGVALSAALWAVVFFTSPRATGFPRWSTWKARRGEFATVATTVAPGVAALGYVLLPPGLRSPLPALGAIVVVGLWTLRPAAGRLAPAGDQSEL
jgi:alpha-1,2-mannosyltransferase